MHLSAYGPRLRLFVGLLLLALGLAACGGAETPSGQEGTDEPAEEPAEEPADSAADDEDAPADEPEPPADDAEEPGEPTETSVRLDWLFTGQQTPFFVARDNGHYEAAGLDVEIVEGSGSSDAAVLVGTGEVDFGVVDASVLASARLEGIPVKAVAVIYQRSPVNLFWLEEEVTIETPADLADGVRVGINERSAHAIGLDAFFSLSDEIDREDINIVPVGFEVEPLIAGQIDAMGGFSNVEPPVLSHEGHDVGQFQVADFGVDLYGLTLVASEETIEDRPELVRAFVEGTMAGFQDSIEDPDGATELFLDANSEGEFDLDKAILEATVELVQSEDTAEHGLGWQNPDTWSNIAQTLYDLDVTSELLEPEDLYSLVAFE